MQNFIGTGWKSTISGLLKNIEEMVLGGLLQKTETIAKEKEASKAVLSTFDFQARFFYERKGYKVVGEIKDYPPGSSYFTMVKMIE